MLTDVTPEDVQACVKKLVDTLNDDFPENPNGALTTVLYLFVRMIDVMEVSREEAMQTFVAALDAQDMAKALMSMETESKWVN